MKAITCINAYYHFAHMPTLHTKVGFIFRFFFQHLGLIVAQSHWENCVQFEWDRLTSWWCRTDLTEFAVSNFKRSIRPRISNSKLIYVLITDLKSDIPIFSYIDIQKFDSDWPMNSNCIFSAESDYFDCSTIFIPRSLTQFFLQNSSTNSTPMLDFQSIFKISSR